MYKIVKAAAVSLRGKPWDKAHNADKDVLGADAFEVDPNPH